MLIPQLLTWLVMWQVANGEYVSIFTTCHIVSYDKNYVKGASTRIALVC